MSTLPATTTRSPAATSEVVAGLGVVALGVSAVLSPDHIEDGPVICPFRLLTGLPCPGCGLTRSWTYLTHGWWQESFLAHPFGALLAVVAVVLAGFAVRARVRGRPAPSFDRLVKHPVAKAVILAWLVFAVVRLVYAI